MSRLIEAVSVFTVPRLTITITDEQDALLTEKTGDNGEYESKSEAVREFIHRGEQATQHIEDLETENERLRNEKRLILEQREEKTELLEYVEQEREAERYRDRRRRQLDEANILQRWRWKLTGVPADGGP